MPGTLFRVDHVVRHVHVEIGRVFMDAAMPLMLGVSQRGGKAFLYGPEYLRRKPGLVLRADDVFLTYNILNIKTLYHIKIQ